MVKRVICLVLVFFISVLAQEELQKATIQLAINAIASNCAEASGMPTEQLQAAIEDKDINQISACFFKCYLNHYGVISREGGRETVNIPMTLVFVKIYIPEISFIDLLNVGAEVMVCAKDFEKSTLPDDQHDCSKTKELVNCLAKRKMLIKAFWLATRS